MLDSYDPFFVKMAYAVLLGGVQVFNTEEGSGQEIGGRENTGSRGG